jgi:hypothetical protein
VHGGGSKRQGRRDALVAKCEIMAVTSRSEHEEGVLDNVLIELLVA